MFNIKCHISTNNSYKKMNKGSFEAQEFCASDDRNKNFNFSKFEGDMGQQKCYPIWSKTLKSI